MVVFIHSFIHFIPLHFIQDNCSTCAEIHSGSSPTLEISIAHQGTPDFSIKQYLVLCIHSVHTFFSRGRDTVRHNLFSGKIWNGFLLFAEGGLDYHWDSCLKGYNQVNQVRGTSTWIWSSLHLILPPSIFFFFFFLSNTKRPTAVGSMGPPEPKANRSCSGVLVRPSRCLCSSPICWQRRPSPLTCCCSHICPAGMSWWSKIIR